MTTGMQPRDRIIPWYFVMFFVVIAGVNAVMVTLAIRTHSGTVTDHPYEKGLAYNQVVNAEERQEALGWDSKISYAQGILNFSLHDKNNQPIIPEKATATIIRPTQSGLDFTLELKVAETPVTFPVNGLWEVRIDAIAGKQHYQKSKRIVVQ
jgi:nitrogen fixation protein FixH